MTMLGLEGKEPPQLYRPRGCPECNDSGYHGRTGIYELVPVDDNLRTMMHDGSGEQALERYARTISPSIRQDGRRRVLAGETTVEEVVRVTRED
jgi:general secretion pathway protein E